MPRKSRKKQFKGTQCWMMKKAGHNNQSSNESYQNSVNILLDTALDSTESTSENPVPCTSGMVVEDDYQPKISASELKLMSSSTSGIHMASLKRAFEEIHGCKGADMLLVVVEDEEKRYGQSWVFFP